MRRIQLVTVPPEGEPFEDESRVRFKEQLLGAVESTPTNEHGQPVGLSTGEMFLRYDLRKKIKAVPEGGWLCLENREYEQLLHAVEAVRWLRVTDALIEFLRAVQDAEEYAVSISSDGEELRAVAPHPNRAAHLPQPVEA